MKSLLERVAALSAAAVLLAACALGGGETRYRLTTLAVEPAGSEMVDSSSRTLAVARPEADRTRDSTRILVRRGRTLLPWSQAAWIDRAPDLLQDLLVQYLDGRVATVGRLGHLPADYRLDLVVRRFELVEQAGGLSAEVELVARLFGAEGQLMAVTSLAETKPSDGRALEAAMTAMEAAVAGVFGALSDWLSPRLRSVGPADGAAPSQ